LVLRQCVQHSIDQHFLEEGAEEEHCRNGDGDGDKWIDAKRGEDDPGQIHAEHQELAVGEIDHSHHAINDGEANPHEGVDTSDENPTRGGLQKDSHDRLPTSRGTDRWVSWWQTRVDTPLRSCRFGSAAPASGACSDWCSLRTPRI